MKDRLKFRMFNKPVKKFSYFSLPELQVCLNRDFKSGLIFPMDESIEDNAIYMGEYKEIQFSTGLKDKNGKLIFEGDIVKFLGIPCKIVFESGQFCIVRNNKIDIDFWYEALEDVWNDDVYPLAQVYFNSEVDQENFIDEVEVIGNIYENPELCKGCTLEGLCDLPKSETKQWLESEEENDR